MPRSKLAERELCKDGRSMPKRLRKVIEADGGPIDY